RAPSLLPCPSSHPLLATAHPHTTLFFFNDTPTTEIYTLSLHDALPIYRPHPNGRPERSRPVPAGGSAEDGDAGGEPVQEVPAAEDRKSTRLNSSHVEISYAVFCLKKKKRRRMGEGDVASRRVVGRPAPR